MAETKHILILATGISTAMAKRRLDQFQLSRCIGRFSHNALAGRNRSKMRDGWLRATQNSAGKKARDVIAEAIDALIEFTTNSTV